ncbi:MULTISPECIES: hypothetical protein [unclassified Xanthobacter]|uniref:hypothetical protein n=1 Tax=unclassified Xanthobacter TaxID=2623496 RepID=UPI001EE0BA77|nr:MULTISPECIES: hypothetical protein [unclassified Xanthobacter]
MNASTQFAEPVPAAPAARTYPLPFSTTPYGCRVEDIPTHLEDGSPLETWDGWSPRDCLNVDRPDGLDRAPPPGWYSVAHWVALTHPHWFDMLDMPMPDLFKDWAEGRGFARDDGDIFDLMAQEGMTPIEWPAPVKAQEAGIPTVLLFPDPILRAVDR